MWIEYFFYVLFGLITFFSFCAVLFRNPVHSVLSLIGVFIACSALFILVSAEFMAMVLAIVYAGAIAILFLFVVIMLDCNKIYKTSLGVAECIFGGISVFLFIFVMFFLFFQMRGVETLTFSTFNRLSMSDIARVLYSDYFLVFELVGVVLLVAMVGSILLTFDKVDRKKNIKSQKPYLQVSRSSKVILVKVDPYKGVNLND